MAEECTYEPIKFELWIDDPELGDLLGWESVVQFDIERYKHDERYARVVSEYIRRGLDYLAREVETIGTMLERDV